MLTLPAQRTKMDLSQPMVMVCAFLVSADRCPSPTVTPGLSMRQILVLVNAAICVNRVWTYMRTMSTCQEPQCVPCRSSEYQDKYTKEDKCIKQPYCDGNLHFQAPVNVKTKKSICLCKEGFHCSTTECTTCVPHKTCEPGFGVQSKDVAMDKQQIQHGTETSDNICEGTSRTHVIVICVVVVGIILIAISGFMYWNCKVKRGNAKGCLKGCVEWCAGGEHEPLATESKLVTTPTSDEESTMPEPLSSQEEGFGRTPEENEDELASQEMSTDVLLTDKGRILTQENGKTEILSRQESQTQTYSA
ncbi:Tumor necrosis factor receptor superfamily member 5 [Larimichthys crocea]|uniref:Uncharacterized protein n=1 Tax=Larimichthys crocea TaxID=215358 RepID=A0ACD3RAW4_LARCR|nr:Tumor necrosis factor receptor superfamily member 5 [Larimichthys crocea]